MAKRKPVYKLIDQNGRVHLPKDLRDRADIDLGDIVRLEYANGGLTAQKVYLVEVGDHSPEAAEEFMLANFRRMSPLRQTGIIRRLCATLPTDEV